MTLPRVIARELPLALAPANATLLKSPDLVSKQPGLHDLATLESKDPKAQPGCKCIRGWNSEELPNLTPREVVDDRGEIVLGKRMADVYLFELERIMVLNGHDNVLVCSSCLDVGLLA